MDALSLLPQFGNAALTLIAFVAALSIIVAVHEYGHYIVGRLSGIAAEVFSIGFGPVLWARMDRHGTRWQVAALPFGGYVKFLGDANAASMGGSSRGLSAAEHRRTMLGAPLWARAATVAAGPAFNFVFSFAIFTGVLLATGTPRDPLTVESLAALPASMAGELAPGDEPLRIAGIAVTDGVMPDSAAPTALVPYVVRRDGTEQEVFGPNPRLPLVGAVNPGSPAWDAGIRAGDVIMAVDGEDIRNFNRLIEVISGSEGRSLTVTLWRAGAVSDLVLTPKRQDLPLAEGGFETRYLIGIVQGAVWEPVTERPGIGDAGGRALEQIRYIVSASVSGLWHVVTGAISTCNLSGPVGIAETSGAMASMGTTSFLWFLGVLSAAIGLLNLFPVPMLDGGHLMFHVWEALTGRPPADGALRLLMSLGLVVVLSLMGFSLLNDLVLCR
ncbi:MAG: RIP metalloprotease RseP [Rubellimicrobium sp.]|nr:RIP metalloprotease RseP [Rubellimicrobium sp.]